MRERAAEAVELPHDQRGGGGDRQPARDTPDYHVLIRVPSNGEEAAGQSWPRDIPGPHRLGRHAVLVHSVLGIGFQTGCEHRLTGVADEAEHAPQRLPNLTYLDGLGRVRHVELGQRSLQAVTVGRR